MRAKIKRYELVIKEVEAEVADEYLHADMLEECLAFPENNHIHTLFEDAPILTAVSSYEWRQLRDP